MGTLVAVNASGRAPPGEFVQGQHLVTPFRDSSRRDPIRSSTIRGPLPSQASQATRGSTPSRSENS